MVKPGDTFLGDPRELGAQVQHLWIVVEVYEPDLEPVLVAVMVNVTSSPVGGDTSCFIDPDEHPYIRHRSFVYYQMAREVLVSKLPALVPHVPVTPELLSRIRKGFHKSDFSPRRLKKLVPQQ